MSLPAPLRFALEAALLVAVGAALAAADLELVPFVLAMAAAWVLVAAGERLLARAGAAEGSVPVKPSLRGEEALPGRPARRPAPSVQPEPAPAPPREEVGEAPAEEEREPERALEVVPTPAEPEPEQEPEPEEEPEPQEEAEQVPEVVALPQPPRRRPDGWNLWELEQRVHELEGQDPIRDEEWSALLMSLRGYARPDGTLPPEFDALVQESFAELIARRT